MRRGKSKPLARPFPKGRQHTWSQQKTFMMLSDRKQDQREGSLYGKVTSLFGQAKFTAPY